MPLLRSRLLPANNAVTVSAKAPLTSFAELAVTGDFVSGELLAQHQATFVSLAYNGVAVVCPPNPADAAGLQTGRVGEGAERPHSSSPRSRQLIWDPPLLPSPGRGLSEHSWAL